MQTKRLLVNLAMLALVVALASFVLFDPFGGTTPQPAPARITALTAEQVRRIAIEPANGESVVLERHGDGWMITSPAAVEAGPARILQLMDLLTAESRGRFPPGGIDAATTGLDAPELIVHFDDALIALGKTNPLTQRRYVQVNDGDIHVIDETRAAFITPAFAAYVSPRLIPDGAELTAIAIGGRTIERAPGGDWQVTSGPALDGPTIIALVDGWQGATALSAEPLREPPADGEEVALRFADGRSLHFAILARRPDVVLARADIGIRYQLPESFGAALFP